MIAWPSAASFALRSAIGVAAQPGYALRAASIALSRSSRVASGTLAITSSLAGLTTSSVAEPVTSSPPISMR